MDLDPYNWEIIQTWDEKVSKYKNPVYSFKVRDKEIKIATHTESLSHTQIPKVALPKYEAWGEILGWCLQENVPGEFPFASGVVSVQARRRRSKPYVCRRRRTGTHEQVVSTTSARECRPSAFDCF
jgi:methylmalonyl-CoA mutase N-terminal domain/subunit